MEYKVLSDVITFFNVIRKYQQNFVILSAYKNSLAESRSLGSKLGIEIIVIPSSFICILTQRI